jgi:outer membrane cobalamin receptor
LLSLFALGTSLSVQAVDRVPSLGEVVVTAHKPVVEQAGVVREVDQAFLEGSAARSLDEAIDLLPGVNVRVGGQGTPRVDVRGFRTRHVKLLVNGIPLNGAGDGQFDPTLIPAEWISRIKLTSGASSQLYGDGALGGVINVITRRGEDAAESHLNLEGGEYGHFRSTGSFAWGNEAADVFFSLGRRTRSSYGLSEDFRATPWEDGGERLNSDLERNNFYGAFSLRPSTILELGLSVQFHEGEHGVPTGVFDADADIYAQRQRWDRVEDEDGWSVQLNMLLTPTARLSNHSWVYLTTETDNQNRYEDERFVPPSDPSVKNTFAREARSRILGFHNQLEYVHDWGGSIAFMVEGRQESLDTECLVQDVPNLPPVVDPDDPDDPDDPADPPDLANADALELAFEITNGASPSRVATLSGKNVAGGAVDFSLTLEDAAGSLFGTGTYLRRLFLNADDATLDRIRFQALGDSEASFTQNNVGAFPSTTDGYAWDYLIALQRAGGVNNPLSVGEKATWRFTPISGSAFKVQDFFQPTLSGSVAGTAFGGMEICFPSPSPWTGPLAPDTSPTDAKCSGNNDFNEHVYLNSGELGLPADTTLAARLIPLDLGTGDETGEARNDTGASPRADDFTATHQALATQVSAPVAEPLPVRVCNTGGDGTGGGDGSGGGTNRVLRVPGYAFSQRLVEEDRQAEIVNAALEVSAEPLTNLGLVAGVGQHWQSNDGGDIAGEMSWNVGATYQLRQGLRLKATQARKVRPASIVQLYDPASGNPDLGFEIADLYEVGVRHAPWLHTSYEVTFFTQDVSGLIQRDLFTGLFENIEETAFKGVEFTTSTVVVPRLRLDLAYTHLASRDESSGTDRKEQQYTPENTVAVSGQYDLSERLKLFASLQHVADQMHYSRGSPRTRRELDDYTLVDLNLRYDLPGRKVGLYIGADNLFDADYAESYGLPQAGRFIYGGIRITLR